MTFDKPRHRDGYKAEDLRQVEATCLSFAVTLGASLNDLCIVGGLVPSLLIDRGQGPTADPDDIHPGTNDLDVGMTVALLDDKGYAVISDRLRQEGFGPATNRKGNATLQTWKRSGQRVTIDFLLPPVADGPEASEVQILEPDFGALIIPGHRTRAVRARARQTRWPDTRRRAGHANDPRVRARSIRRA
jgi:hypothetical protein